jgi:hypothetical protein
MHPEFAQVRALVFEPYTHFRVRPMSGCTVNVTEHGYRRGNPVEAWPPDPTSANVFVFGGSTAFGYGVSDDETIPARVADQLSHLLPAKRVSIYNFATPNHAGMQERIQFEQLLLNGHVPRVAIFIDGFNEFVAPYYSPVMLKPFVDATASHSTSQRFARTIRDLVTRKLGRSAGVADDNGCRLPDPRLVLDQYMLNVRLINAVCREFAVRPLFVWQPVPCYHYDGEHLHGTGHRDSASLMDCVRTGYKMMDSRRANDVSGDRFLWLADIQRGRTDNLYVDADHYTAEFSHEIAKCIAQHLVAGGLLE